MQHRDHSSLILLFGTFIFAKILNELTKSHYRDHLNHVGQKMTEFKSWLLSSQVFKVESKASGASLKQTPTQSRVSPPSLPLVRVCLQSSVHLDQFVHIKLVSSFTVFSNHSYITLVLNHILLNYLPWILK